MGEFRISHVRISFGLVRWRDKKAGARVVGWSPDFFSGDGDGGHPHIPAHPASPTGGTTSIPHSNAPHYPISPHIDEDALEGLYFAFSTILRCLPYFLRKTRPRASYELLEAFSSSLAADRASAGRVGMKFHARIWEPGSLKVGLSITPEPPIRILVG